MINLPAKTNLVENCSVAFGKNFFDMSRIGKLPVEIPSGVTVSFENDVVSVKGPKV